MRAMKAVAQVVKQLPRSAWTPILAPLAAAGLTSINQPQIDKAGAANDPLDKPLIIPPHDHPVGPMTRARQRRLAAMFASAQLAGVGAVAVGAGPRARGLGRGHHGPGRRLPLQPRPRPLRR